jgi:uncharacterized membrane protein
LYRAGKVILVNLKPIYVYFLLLPIMTYVFYGHFSEETRSAQHTIDSATRVSGKVTQSKYSVRSKDYWVDVSIPSTFGVTQCSGSITEDDHAAMQTSGHVIDVYVSPDRNALIKCRTASALKRDTRRTTADILFIALFLGAVASFLFYYLIVRIRFGASRQSLKSRWSDGTK